MLSGLHSHGAVGGMGSTIISLLKIQRLNMFISAFYSVAKLHCCQRIYSLMNSRLHILHFVRKIKNKQKIFANRRCTASISFARELRGKKAEHTVVSTTHTACRQASRRWETQCGQGN